MRRLLDCAVLAALLAIGPAVAGTHRVVDMAGREVVVPDEIRRIGCLEVLCYEKLFLLGASERIVLMTRTNAPWMRQTNPAQATIRQLAADPDGEEILAQRVDVVFRSFGYPAAGKLERLAALGVPVVAAQPVGRLGSADDFIAARKRMLRLYAAVLGGPYPARAEAWCVWHDRQVARVRAGLADLPRAQRVRLFHVRGPGATQTQGVGSNTYWYGELAGAAMVVGSNPLQGKGPVSIEEILRWNPQVITIGRHYPATLVTADPRWASIDALRHGRVIELPEGVFYWDGSTEGVLLMLFLAKTLYPERFADLDLRREIADYYRRFYRYSLSQRELDLMLAGRGPDGERRNEMNN